MWSLLQSDAKKGVIFSSASHSADTHKALVMYAQNFGKVPIVLFILDKKKQRPLKLKDLTQVTISTGRPKGRIPFSYSIWLLTF